MPSLIPLTLLCFVAGLYCIYVMSSSFLDAGDALQPDGTLKDGLEILWNSDADKLLPFPLGTAHASPPSVSHSWTQLLPMSAALLASSTHRNKHLLLLRTLQVPLPALACIWVSNTRPDAMIPSQILASLTRLSLTWMMMTAVKVLVRQSLMMTMSLSRLWLMLTMRSVPSEPHPHIHENLVLYRLQPSDTKQHALLMCTLFSVMTKNIYTW